MEWSGLTYCADGIRESGEMKRGWIRNLYVAEARVRRIAMVGMRGNAIVVFVKFCLPSEY